MITALLWAAPAWCAPHADVVYAFEPQLLTLGQSDEALVDYGFTPVGSGFVPAHSVRGALELDGGTRVGLSMATAFGLRRDERSAVPTTLQLTRIGAHVGRAVTARVRLGGDLGFATVTHSVGSEVQGGGLAYLGPYGQPRLAVRLVDHTAVVELAAGWTVHVPLGPAHSNPLWEEPFTRPVIHGPLVSVQVGFGTREAP